MRKTTVEAIHFGDEPIIDEKLDLGNALNWYSLVQESKDAKKYLITYLKNANRKSDANIVNLTSYSQFENTMGWIARLLTRGADISESDMNWFNNRLDSYIESHKDLAKIADKPIVKKSPISLMKQSLKNNIIGELDAVVDSRNSKFDVYSFLKEKEVAPKSATYIKEFFQPELDYIIRAIEGDVLAKEYYSQSKTELNKLKKVLEHIITESDRFATAQKKVRCRKAKSTNDLLKKFQYKVEDNALQIASVNPNKLIGAKSAYLYDCKSRKLTYLVATDDLLTIKGTTFANVDEEKTITKKLATKIISETIHKIAKSKIRAAKNVIDGLNTKPVRSPKRTTNEFIILNTFTK